MNRIDLFCPKCKKRGFRKKLMEIDDETTGIVYPYCKYCKENIPIKVPVCRVNADK